MYRPHRYRPKHGAPPAALAVGIIALVVAAPILLVAAPPSSANYTLIDYAITGGNLNQSSQPYSANYTLQAGSLGGIAGPQTGSASYAHDPGYLVPDVEGTVVPGEPHILSAEIRNGRVYLTWRVVPSATYTILSSAVPSTGYNTDNTGSRVGESWNCPMPAVDTRFYRVQATVSH